MTVEAVGFLQDTAFRILDRFRRERLSLALSVRRLRFESLSACPSCASSSEAWSVGPEGRDFRARIRTSECTRCSLVFQNPRLTSESASMFYRRYYRNSFHTRQKSEQLFARSCRRGSEIVKFLGQDLDGVRSALEVGCGYGGILVALARRGIDVQGCDENPMSVSVATAHGVPVTLGGFDALPERRYDLIILSHVLEHVDQPVPFLERLKSLLAPGGSIFIEVPRIVASTEDRVFQLGHVLYFDSKSLANVLSRVGLSIQKLEDRRDVLRRLVTATAVS